MKQSRRDFLKTTGMLAGVSLLVRYLPPSQLLASAKTPAGTLIPPPTWMAGPGAARHRYEGLAKVTGAKIYARDYRARDMPNWPKDEVRVVILKATSVDRILLGVNFDALPVDARPFKVLTQNDFEKLVLTAPPFFKTKLFARLNAAPDFLGQAVALAFFKNDAFLSANPFLINPDAFLRYGDKVSAPTDRVSYLDAQMVKYKDNGRLLFSHARDSDLIRAPFPEASEIGSPAQRAMHFAQKIGEELKEKKLKVFSGEFSTQSVDPLFMEPENGLAWYDASKKTLRIVSGSQSPYADAEHVAQVFSDKKCTLPISVIEVDACYPGGGFGGKDHSLFPIYLALAARILGKPVRIVNSRFEQFQFGLKRHPSKIKESLAIDADGKFQILQAQMDFDGGGNDNFSWCVPVVAADNAGSGYYFPKTHVHIRGLASSAVPSGSMRGFGALQAQFSLETLIDEAAEKLGIDAIELRERNIFTALSETLRGRLSNSPLQIDKILQMAKQHYLWQERKAIHKRTNKEKAYGVGFALTMKSFGSTRDAVIAEVQIHADGTLSVASNYLDMGNGVATTLALATADSLGNNASEMHLGESKRFDVLKLFAKFCTEDSQLEELAKNVRFTPEVMMSSAASAGAYQHRHVIIQASRLLFSQSIWPTALALWGRKDLSLQKASWKQSKLQYPGLPDLSMSELARALYTQDRPVAVMAHGYYQAGWAQAVFALREGKVRLEIDALAMKKAHKPYEIFDRLEVQFPSVKSSQGGEDIFTPCAALCQVAVDLKTGLVAVEEMHNFLDCGPIIQHDIVEGQSQGAVAMGIGQVLYEHYPQFEGGPGAGGWNLHRYKVPLASDVPLYKQQLHLVEPVPGESPKGMAEVVLHPILPALTNAIAHAMNKRFYNLPILPNHILGVL